MPVADTSYLVKSRLLKGKTLSVFKKLNGGRNEFIGSDFSQNEYSVRDLGDKFGGCCGTQCVPPGPVSITVVSSNVSVDPPYLFASDITWTSENATSYTVTAVYEDPDETSLLTVERTGPLSATVKSVDVYVTVTVTAMNECGSSSATLTGLNPCFLAGSLVQMANGSVTPIEDIKVGDLVLGAFGEVNSVLALHRPILGTGRMCKINGEHSTTNHHPHISVDKKFYSNDPQTVNEKTYGRYHQVIDGSGNTVQMLLPGLRPDRVQQLTVGVELKTVNGSKLVELLEVYSMSPATQLYNLVVGGSHTYHVDGYAVTGWPREDDFDYDTWTRKAL